MFAFLETSKGSLLIVRPPPGVMDPRESNNAHASKRAFFLVGLLLLAGNHVDDPGLFYRTDTLQVIHFIFFKQEFDALG